jgi:hypothetical protein
VIYANNCGISNRSPHRHIWSRRAIDAIFNRQYHDQNGSAKLFGVFDRQGLEALYEGELPQLVLWLNSLAAVESIAAFFTSATEKRNSDQIEV